MKSSTFAGFDVLIAVCNILIYSAIAYGIGSAVTSGIKSVNKECGVTYGVESLVDGNWFCKQ